MGRRASSTNSRRRQRAAPQAPPPEPPPSRGLVALVAGGALMASILERWFFVRAWGEARVPWSAFYVGDASRFVNFTVAILRSQPFDNGIPFHPPGWPLALAAFLRVSGAVREGEVVFPVMAVKLFVASLSGLTVGAATLLAYEMAGFGAMLAVALLGPFNFGHIVEGTVANSEALYGLFTTLALWAVWRWLRRPSTHPTIWATSAGAIGGLAMLVRPEFLACFVALLAVAAWTRPTGWRHQIVLCTGVFAAMLVPTTVWHWRALATFNAAHVGRVAGPLPRLAPVTSYGPFNFAMANHEDADGGPNRDHPLLDRCSGDTDARLTGGELDLACPAVYDIYVNGYAIGAGWLLRDPVAALRLMGQKLVFAAGFLAHGYLIDDAGAGVDGTRRRVDLVDPDSWLLLPVHLVLTIAGVVLFRKRPIALGVLAAPVVALVASTLMFYGYVRLGVAYLPAFWILQGTAASAFVGRARRRVPPRTAGAAVAVAIVMLLTLDSIRSIAPRSVRLEGARGPDGTLMQDETLVVRRPVLP